jgi:hypothetical protein
LSPHVFSPASLLQTLAYSLLCFCYVGLHTVLWTCLAHCCLKAFGFTVSTIRNVLSRKSHCSLLLPFGKHTILCFDRFLRVI